MLQRIRQAFDDSDDDNGPFNGPVEVDESYFGGKRASMSSAECKKQTGRGTAGQTAVVGMQDRDPRQVRAQIVAATGKASWRAMPGPGPRSTRTKQPPIRSFPPCSTAMRACSTRPASTCMAHTNGLESFWSMLRRGYIGVHHKMSPKHLGRYVAECSGRHNLRVRHAPPKGPRGGRHGGQAAAPSHPDCRQRTAQRGAVIGPGNCGTGQGVPDPSRSPCWNRTT